MYDYIVKELPKLLSDNFSQLDTTRASISGHSMGGHGALTIYLKNLDKYKVFFFCIPLFLCVFKTYVILLVTLFMCGTFSLCQHLHQLPIP